MKGLLLAHRRPRGRRTESGYSLMEVLVMLALTAIVSALVLQTVRAASAAGLRIERHSRTTIHDRLDMTALRRAVSAVMIDYAGSSQAFRGDFRQATGLTTRPMSATDHAVLPFRLGIETGTDGSVVYYEEDGAGSSLCGARARTCA